MHGHAAGAVHAAAMYALPPGTMVGLLAAPADTAGYLLVLMLMAALVYERLGLRLLGTAWIDLTSSVPVPSQCTAVLTLLV